jgi:AraC-like DNA-binding protein
MTADPVDSSERPFKVGVLHGRESLGPYMPGLGWLDFDAGGGAQHVDLPSDLFTVSLQCGEAAGFDEQLEKGLHVVISPVRVTSRPFVAVGRAQVAVATLTPLGMLSAFGAEASSLADVPVPLDHLCGRARERRLASALRDARSVPQRVETFGRWLEEQILDTRGLATPTLRVAHVAMTVVQAPAQPLGIVDLAHRFSVTRRQLERDFRACLGVSPGAYARVVRFQRAASAVASGQPLPYAALDHGFADQSHMNRAFQAFAAVTPRELAREGARVGRATVRAGMGGRVFLLDAHKQFVMADPDLPRARAGDRTVAA